MKTIHVALDSTETTFSSIVEATSSPSSRERQSLAKKTTAVVKDLTIEGASWKKDSLHLLLADGKTLCFALSKSGVAWNVESQGEHFLTMDEDAAPTLLCFPDGTSSLWDPASVIRTRINRKIVRLGASIAWVFLYTEQCSALLLTQLCDDKGDVRLYWSDLNERQR
jgi:hypothetical protein